MAEPIKLIACDIDNTLLPFGRTEISAGNKKAIEEARAAGVAFVLATGRHYMTAARRVHELDMPDMPVIASNGTDIRINDKSVYTYPMDDETVRALAEKISGLDLPLYVFCGDEILCQEKDENSELFEIWKEESGGDNPVRMLPSLEEVLAEAAGNTQKLLSDVGENLKEGTGDPVRHQQILSELQREYGDRADIACGGGLNIEINAPLVSKGHALEAVCRMLNVPLSQTMAIGDSGNDVQMLEAAGLGVAVGNAMEEAREAADVVTDSCEEDGVAKIIRQYVLGQADEN